MGIQLSDCVESIVGKGEIAQNEQFLLFPQCFHKLPLFDASKRVMHQKVWFSGKFIILKEKFPKAKDVYLFLSSPQLVVSHVGRTTPFYTQGRHIHDQKVIYFVLYDKLSLTYNFISMYKGFPQ